MSLLLLLKSSGPSFPVQYSGLRAYFQGSVKELCLVIEDDAPPGIGGVPIINKNGILYAIYLVEADDPNASPIRIRTTLGTKAIRLKT
jgi:hypothetical protein